MKGISIKGIVVATVVMVIMDSILGVVLALVLRDDQPIDQLVMTTLFLLGSTIFGMLTTILSGYLAARIAGVRHYANAAVMGGIGIVIGIFTAGSFPLWFNLVGFIFVVPAALLGGHIAASSQRRNA
jgi:hypothetical protein